MRTKQQLIEYLHEKMILMEPLSDAPKPDLATCQDVATYVSKMSARHGLGGDICRLAQSVKGPEDTLALLADCLAALQTEGNDSGPFTVEEVAERWSVSVRTVGDLIRNGQLGCFRPGNGRGVVRISTEHIAEYEHGQTNGRNGRHRHL
jgi:excisionase family DNA binding protein